MRFKEIGYAYIFLEKYMFYKCHVNLEGISRTGPDRAGPSRTEPDRAGPSRTEPDRAGPSRTGPDRAGPGRTELRSVVSR